MEPLADVTTTPAIRLPSRLLRNAEVLASRDDILDRLVPDRSFAEVGVALGDRTRLVLDRLRPAKAVAIDRFELDRQASLWGRPVEQILGGRSHRAFFEARFEREIGSGLLSVLADAPEAGLGRLADNSLDVVLLDAGHSYDEVRGQMHAAVPKLRNDGVVVINDYVFNDVGPRVAFYGVVQSVNDFMVQQDWEMLYLSLHPKMFFSVAIRRCA